MTASSDPPPSAFSTLAEYRLVQDYGVVFAIPKAWVDCSI